MSMLVAASSTGEAFAIGSTTSPMIGLIRSCDICVDISKSTERIVRNDTLNLDEIILLICCQYLGRMQSKYWCRKVHTHVEPLSLVI